MMNKKPEWWKCPNCGQYIPKAWRYHEKCGWKQDPKDYQKIDIPMEMIPETIKNYAIALEVMGKDMKAVAEKLAGTRK
jgi:hypothetical protein